MKFKHQLKSIFLTSLMILSLTAFCFLNSESKKQDSQKANLITVPVQETATPALPDIKIFYSIINIVKGGLLPGQ